MTFTIDEGTVATNGPGSCGCEGRTGAEGCVAQGRPCFANFSYTVHALPACGSPCFYQNNVRVDADGCTAKDTIAITSACAGNLRGIAMALDKWQVCLGIAGQICTKAVPQAGACANGSFAAAFVAMCADCDQFHRFCRTL